MASAVPQFDQTVLTQPKPKPIGKTPGMEFPPPTPVGIPVRVPGSTDPDAEFEQLEELMLDEDDEQFVVELD
jgi:hypothetical protein